MGLARFNAVFFLPIYQALLVLAGVLAGGVYFNEFSQFDVDDWFGFLTGATQDVSFLLLIVAIGVALTVLGLVVLIHGRGEHKSHSYSAVVDSTYDEPAEWVQIHYTLQLLFHGIMIVQTRI